MAEQSDSTPKLTRRQRWQGSRYAYQMLGTMAVLLVAAATVVFHYLEGWSWVDSFYFSAVAGTTVGFGDLSPSTDASKLFSVVYIFFAIGIIGTFLEQRMKYHGVIKNRAEKAISTATDTDKT